MSMIGGWKWFRLKHICRLSCKGHSNSLRCLLSAGRGFCLSGHLRFYLWKVMIQLAVLSVHYFEIVAMKVSNFPNIEGSISLTWKLKYILFYFGNWYQIGRREDVIWFCMHKSVNTAMAFLLMVSSKSYNIFIQNSLVILLFLGFGIVFFFWVFQVVVLSNDWRVCLVPSGGIGKDLIINRSILFYFWSNTGLDVIWFQVSLLR